MGPEVLARRDHLCRQATLHAQAGCRELHATQVAQQANSFQQVSKLLVHCEEDVTCQVRPSLQAG